MHIRWLPNSRPTKGWVRPWMIWVAAFILQFLPRFIVGLARAPLIIAKYEWEDMRDEVVSFNCDRTDPPADTQEDE